MKKSDFSKLKPIGKGDKILLLTHTDMDGSGVVVLNQMFDNVEIRNCSNNNMSYVIKKHVLDSNEYDTILVVDISCNKEDAEVIDKSPNKKKLVLLDHHETALHLNQYGWAVVEPSLVEDSFRTKYYEGLDGGHSSGTSLLYDFLDYQGHTERVKNKELLEEYVNLVAMYDTWDWNDLFGKDEKPKQLEDVFEMYGIDMFQRVMSEKIENGEALVGIEEESLLRSFKEEEDAYVCTASEAFEEGVVNIQGKPYTFVMSVSDAHLGAVLDRMKGDFEEADLHIVNYGSGISLRTLKEGIHIGNLVKQFGGGGHPKAGGMRISKELQVAQIEKNLPGVSLYIDRDEKGYIKTQKDIKFEEISNLDKYTNLSKLEALREEAEDRKRNKSIFLIKKGIITGMMEDENNEYSSFVMAFTSNHKEEAMSTMREMFPSEDVYFVCSDTSFEYEDTKSGKTKSVVFSEDSILSTMSQALGGASFSLEKDREMEL